MIVLAILPPMGVVNVWSRWLTTGMLPATIVLLARRVDGDVPVAAVAVDRRMRRRPLCGASPTVGQLEDAAVEQRVRDPRQTPSPGMRQ
ncbi:MAG: hypothetical protein ACLQBX_14655 [Candidatus Limnocylindrales bacterium]